VKRWTVYLLRCGDGSLYTGITNRLAARMAAHRAGKGGRYTRSRLPVVLAWCKRGQAPGDARRLEAALKRLRPTDKARLAAGDAGLWRRLRRTTLGTASGR
jgi:putative endonuclease